MRIHASRVATARPERPAVATTAPEDAAALNRPAAPEGCRQPRRWWSGALRGGMAPPRAPTVGLEQFVQLAQLDLDGVPRRRRRPFVQPDPSSRTSTSTTSRGGFGSTGTLVLLRQLTSCSASPARNARLARPRRGGRFRLPHHRRRALLGRVAPTTASRSKQIERDIEAPTAELDGMCRELVGARGRRRADAAASCAFPSGSGPSSRQAGSAAIRASTVASICATTGRGRRSCSNTTPTRRPRCSRPACSSGCGSNRRSSGNVVPKGSDQYNSLHERLIAGWKEIGQGRMPAPRRHDRHGGGCRHRPLSRGLRPPGRPDHDGACHGRRSGGSRTARSSTSTTGRSS